MKSINCDPAALGFAKRPASELSPEKNRNPPKKANSPKRKATRSHILCLFGVISENRPANKIGVPIMAGIHDVIDLLSIEV